MKKAVVVQCRLGSTRLKNKALKLIDNKTILEYVLNSMKKVDASIYYVVTDFYSLEKLKPIVEKCGWNIFAGSEFDVLDRFCSFLRFIDNTDIHNFPQIIIRATADNPFLFYDAAKKMIESYEQKIKTGLSTNPNFKIDYFTWTGLPHGSGVEILSTLSLLESINYTSDPYDHEHVGPALYNHKDRYNCVFEPAPEKWNHPKLRTTVDTINDFYRAKTIVNYIKNKERKQILENPIDSQTVIDACNSDAVKTPLLFVPNVDGKHGSGHLKRVLDLASVLCADIYIPPKKNSKTTVLDKIIEKYILQGLIYKDQILSEEIPKDFYSSIILDNFCTSQKEIDYFSQFAKVLSIDEGSNSKILEKISYSVNVIPSLIKYENINLTNFDLIPLPKNQKDYPAKLIKDIKKVIIAFGGTDKSFVSINLASKLENIFLSEKNEDFEITIVTNNKQILENEYSPRIVPKNSIENLREKIYEYDLVITHYGFTAFEAVSSNCLVLTLSPTKLHKKLSKKMGFTNIHKGISEDKLKKELKNLFEKEDSDFIVNLKKNNLNKIDSQKEFSSLVRTLSEKEIKLCPVCNSKSIYLDKIISRDKIKTIRRCKICNLDYISFENAPKTQYNADYFGIEYKNQYGKTYLEDFNSIKNSCLRRHKIIDLIFTKKIANKESRNGKVLDIGCAYGPYLSAAKEFNWIPYGIEPSEDAVNYVRNKLNFSAICSKFPMDEIPNSYSNFDAITMWYVIEHFENLDEVLKSVYMMLNSKGIFAFSTPSNRGISGKYNPVDFYKNSPSDHFSIWNPKTAKKILKKYGFKTVKIVSTGIHPERFPFIKKHGIKKEQFLYKFFEFYAKLFSLGDTFEIYTTKK